MATEPLTTRFGRCILTTGQAKPAAAAETDRIPRAGVGQEAVPRKLRTHESDVGRQGPQETSRSSTIADPARIWPDRQATPMNAVDKYRLVARILYPSQKVFVVKVMTHAEYAEYDEDKWQADCGCFEAPPPKTKQTKTSPPKRKHRGTRGWRRRRPFG